MIPFKLLLKFTIIMSVISGSFGAEDKIIKCVRCGGGNFKNKQYLFFSPELPIHMAWLFAWEKTDCHAGNFTIVNCPSSCITVITERDFQDHQGYKYDGIMMDCSDDLIHSSIDLPRHIDFRHYKGDEVFSATRQLHNITYIFSSRSVETVEHIVKLPIKSMPESVAAPTFWDQKFFTLIFKVLSAVFLGCSVVFLCRCCCGILNSYCCEENYPQKTETTYYKQPDLEMESLPERSYCSQTASIGNSSQILVEKLDEILEHEEMSGDDEEIEEEEIVEEEIVEESPILVSDENAKVSSV